MDTYKKGKSMPLLKFKLDMVAPIAMLLPNVILVTDSSCANSTNLHNHYIFHVLKFFCKYIIMVGFKCTSEGIILVNFSFLFLIVYV